MSDDIFDDILMFECPPGRIVYFPTTKMPPVSWIELKPLPWFTRDMWRVRAAIGSAIRRVANRIDGRGWS